MPTDSAIHFLMIDQRWLMTYSRRFLFCCTHKDSRCCFSCLCHMSPRSVTDSCTVLHSQSSNHWRNSYSQASSSGGESCRLARRWLLKASPIQNKTNIRGICFTFFKYYFVSYLWYKRNGSSVWRALSLRFTKYLVVYHCKCCNLIGYATLSIRQ